MLTHIHYMDGLNGLAKLNWQINLKNGQLYIGIGLFL